MDSLITFLNALGKSFVAFSIPMLIQSALLIILLLVLDLLIRKKVRAIFRYWIWMLVLVKLVLPTSLSSPTGLGYWLGDKVSPLITKEVSIPEQTAPIAPTIEPFSETASSEMQNTAPPSTGTVPAPVALAPAESAAAPSPPAVSLSWKGLVFLGWLAAVTAMALLLVQRLFFVRGLLAQSENPNKSMMDIFDRCRKQMKIRGRINLKLSPVAAGPSVCGLFRPTILLPQNLPHQINPGDLKSIFLHELAHIKRGDLWVSLVQTILQIAYFYNPLLWVANAIIRKIREQAVDEMVLVAMGEQADDYPQTLLNISRLTFTRPALSLRLIGVVESKKALSARIRHILNHPLPKSAKLGIAGFIVVLIFGAIALPMAGRIEGRGNQALVQILKEDGNRKRGNAAKKLMDNVRSGTIAPALAEEALQAVTRRLQKHPKSRGRRLDSYPYVCWEELELAWVLIENDKVPADYVSDFVQALEVVGCTYGKEGDGVFRLYGDLNIPRKDIITNYKLHLLSMNHEAAPAKKVLLDVFTRSEGGGLHWGREQDSKLNPEISANLELKVVWYQATDSFTESLPSVWTSKDSEHAHVMRNASLRKLCEYTQVMTLSQESGWEGTFGSEVLKKGNSLNKFRATLPNGVTVELLGICEHPSEGKQWWRPDGQRLDYTIKTLDPSGYPSDEPGYELVFRKTGDDDFDIQSIKGSNVKSGLRVIDPEDLTGYRAHIKKSYKKTNIKIASPSGKWKTAVTSSGKGSFSGNIRGKTIVFAGAEQAGKDVIISCSDVVGYKNATRIIAVDPKGKELTGQTRTDTGVNNVRQRTIRFSNVNLADIAEFKFQTCPYEYYTFKNVSLKPNLRTDVAVEVEGAEAEEMTDTKGQDIASRAAEAMNAGDFERAQALSAEAVELDPDFAEAWTGMGMACVRAGDYKGAKESYERALSFHQERYRKDPSNANHVQQQIFLLVLLGRDEEAKSLLSRARLQHPEDEQLKKFEQGGFAALEEDPQYILPKADKLEFRVVPNQGPQGKHPAITPGILKDYIETLKAKGPDNEIWEDSGFYSKYRWIEIHDLMEDLPITALHDGKRYGLLCNFSAYVMLADGRWGLVKVEKGQDSRGRPDVVFTFDEKGGELFYQLTNSNTKNRLAIIDGGKVVSAPQVMAAIRNAGIIVGSFSEQQVDEMVASLRKGMVAGEAFEGQTSDPEREYKATLPNGVTVEPELEFLAWQSDTGDPNQFWHPDGSVVREANELDILNHVRAVRYATLPDEGYVFLYLWFSHARFDKDSKAGVRMLNYSGEHMKLGPEGCTFHEYGGKGRIVHTVTPGDKEDFPANCDVELHYGIGQWQDVRREGEISPDFRGSMALGNLIELGGIGENSEGNAFASYVKTEKDTAADTQCRSDVQCRFLAVNESGQVFEPFATRGGGNADLFREEFEFKVPLKEIAHFKFQKRPVKVSRFENVSLKPDFKTDVNIEVEESAKPATSFYENKKVPITVEANVHSASLDEDRHNSGQDTNSNREPFDVHSSDAITFHLTDSNGRPVQRAFVGTRASWQDYEDEARFGRPRCRGVFYGSRPSRARATDREGKGAIAAEHLFRPNSSENEMVTIVALQAEEELVRFVEVAPKDVGKTVEIPMRSACRITGKLVSNGLDKLGRSLGWTNVYVHQGDSRPFSSSSEYRRFGFLLPPGQYTMEAYGAGTEHVYKQLQVLPGQKEITLEIDLPPDIMAVLEGQEAPQLAEIKGWKNGSAVKLSDLRGKVLLLDFWGYWCAPCMAEMPKLMDLHDKYSDKGLVIIGVHDDSIESIPELDNKLRKVKNAGWAGREIPFLIALDGGGDKVVEGTDRTVRGATTAAYGVSAFPTSVLIDKRGRLVGRFNVHSAADIRKLEDFLASPEDLRPHAAHSDKLDTEIYRLKEYDVLKHIKPDQVRAKSDLKFPFAAFNWTDGEGAKQDGPIFEQVTLKDVLTAIVRLSKFEYECSEDLLSTNLNGDWIVRHGVPKRDKMEALHRIIRDQLQLPIRLQHRVEEKDIIVARGRFNFRPLSGTHDDSQIHVYGESLNLEGRGFHDGGNLQSLLDTVAERIVGKPIVNLSEPSEAGEYAYVWLFHRPSTFIDGLSPEQRSRKVRLILDNLSEHISLTFTEERRPVDVWDITSTQD
ncbi:MAG TPA: M56 family metallopeptidase [Sedimentisphaerales bacterium]|nr:M56 family metallopeptidase [Sedimentisphaerales bacterium]